MRCRSRIPPRTLDCLAVAAGFFLVACGALPTAGPTASQIISQQAEAKQPPYKNVTQ
jgi:hypothetical protein